VSARTRRAFLTLAQRVTPFVAAADEEGVFLLSTHEAGLGRHIFVAGGTPEFEALAVAVRILREHGRAVDGSVFLDVGANIGTTTIPALLRHGYGRGLCFEPEPDNVPLLRANVALNRLADRVEVVDAAVADAAGRATFVRGPETRHGRRTGVGALNRTDAKIETVEVDVVTLDEELEKRDVTPDDVGLLWIDAQGGEGHVLRGAHNLTEARVPVVFALRSKKLREAGGVEPLLERLSDYASSVDLRDPAAALAPISELPERVRRKPNTDLLVL
jgi:FkbM family methyltransferase